MGILKGDSSDDLTLKYLLQNVQGGEVDLSGIQSQIDNINAELGDTPLPTTAQTITGAIDEICPIAFTVTLASGSWSSNAQTVSNVNFVASGYAYVVSPTSASFVDYGSAQIYADNVTTNGQMTFHCVDVPTSALTVNIIRMVSA